MQLVDITPVGNVITKNRSTLFMEHRFYRKPKIFKLILIS